MKITDLKELSDEQVSKVNVGFSMLALAAGLTQLATAITPIIGLIKSMFSTRGEIKGKEFQFKWDDSKTSNSKTLDSFISF
ncbi:hypothetical protein ACJA23_00405 [Mycoplasma corogypsi]|uniref:hypothetical protein n=1 Tax=Mycoplasma corogypsi TaxID=2106 RepID=UPI0038731819